MRICHEDIATYYTMRLSTFFNRAAPRNGGSPRNSLLPLSIQQARAAAAPPHKAPSLS